MKEKFAWMLLLIALLGACQQPNIHNYQGVALGTYFSITYVGNQSKELPHKVDSVLSLISKEFSIFDSSSIVSRINRNEYEDTLPTDLEVLLNIANTVSKVTSGAFDITAAPLVNAWGFGSSGECTNMTTSQIDSLRALVGYDKIAVVNHHLVKENLAISLDFNAIAKGFAVDKVATLLKQCGYSNFVIDIGGEVVTSGRKTPQHPWRVGIQVPTQTQDGLIETNYLFDMENQSIATSGSYRNYKEIDGQRFCHIVNPCTGIAEHSTLLSVSVIAPTCAIADAYATGFMVLGIEKSMCILQKDTSIAAHFIYYENGQYKYIQTDNFPKQ